MLAHSLSDFETEDPRFALPGAGRLGNSRIAYVIDCCIGGGTAPARPGIENPKSRQAGGSETGPPGGYILKRRLDFVALPRFSPTCTAMPRLSYGK